MDRGVCRRENRNQALGIIPSTLGKLRTRRAARGVSDEATPVIFTAVIQIDGRTPMYGSQKKKPRVRVTTSTALHRILLEPFSGPFA